jgi:class 3 adenylate cyclase
MDIDWQIYTETFGQVLWAFPNPDFGHAFGTFMRACSDPETHRAFWKAWEAFDVVSLLPSISVPTLVVHNKNSRLIPFQVGQRTAAAIPGARFAPIDDFTYAVVAGLLERFVQETSVASSAPHASSGTAVILFADIVDSTALAEQLGNATFRERSRVLEQRVREQVTAHGGTPVEGRTLGDGVLATFASASDAIAAALDCATAGEEVGLALHLGLHAGDVMREGGNVHGQAVSIASRVSDLSAPNEVLVSGTVRDLARASAGVSFEDRGERELKGVSEPVRVYAVRGA